MRLTRNAKTPKAAKIPEERGRTAFPARSAASLSPRKRLRLTRLRSGYPDLRSNSHVSERFYVALARRDAGIRSLGGSDENAAAAGALRKGCGPMTMRY